MRRKPLSIYEQWARRPLRAENLRETPVRDHREAQEWINTFRDHDPRHKMFFDSMHKWHKMTQLDQDAFAGMVKLGGKENKAWEHIGSAPMSDLMMMYKFHPDILQDRKEFYRWLKAGDYVVPGAKL